MKNNILSRLAFTFIWLTLIGVVFVSCEDDDDDSNNVLLEAFGPSPVLRGNDIHFIGENLNRINSIVLPPNIEITEINVVSPSELTITVPQDAQEGVITLNFDGGSITTKTRIGFTEPYELSSISPIDEAVRAGDLITITGDYLNNIVAVSFFGGASVDSSAFESQTRKEIVLGLPEEAQSGKIIVEDEAGNQLYSEEELIVSQPEFVGFQNSVVKAGSNLTVEGENLDLVKSIEFPGGAIVELQDFVEVSATQIVVAVPSNSQDGVVSLISVSNVVIPSRTEIEMIVPTITGITPSEIRNGEEITVTGENLDLISGVSFTGGGEVDVAVGGSSTELTVVTPETGLSGAVTFKTLAGKEVVWSDGVTFTAPSVTALNPATISPNNTLTLTGENLDLVAGIVFAGGMEGEIQSQSASEIQVFVPIGSETGSITLIAKNGAEIETTQTLTVNAPEFCYIPAIPGSDVEINAGEVFTVEVLNGDVLTDVKVNGYSSQYILQGTSLLFLVPSNAAGATDLTLVSSNGEITYSINVIGSGPVETVIMNETRDLGSWAGEGDGGAFRLYKSSFQGVPAGSILKFYFTASSYNQLQLNDANWSQQAIVEITDPTQTSYEMELTQELLDHILTTEDGWSETALIVQGEGLVISQVSVLTFSEGAGGETIWEGEEVLGNWESNIQLPASSFSNAQVGSILSVSVKDLDASSDYWQVALKNSSWEDIEIKNLAQGDSGVEFAVDEAVLGDMQSSGVIIQGAFATVTKIELK